MNFLENILLRTPKNCLLSLFFNKISMINFFSETENEEALLLASPNLHHVFIKFKNNEVQDSKEAKKIEISLKKYYNRMHSRCTPYGLFAGCSIVNSDNENDITLSNDLTRQTRLDMLFVCNLAKKLEGLSELKPYLTYSPNSSLQRQGSKYRYVEYYYENSIRKHRISSVEITPYLEFALTKCLTPTTIFELEKELQIFEPTVTLQDIKSYINEIISSQLLVSNIEPNVVNTDFFDVLIKELKIISNKYSVPQISSILSLMNEVKKELLFLDKTFINKIEIYFRISDILKIFKIEIDMSKLFQTDLYKPLRKSTINLNFKSKFKNILPILSKLGGISGSINLNRFKEEFYDRYELQEVPLLIALDTEMGIGYGALLGEARGDFAPFVDDIVDAAPITEQQIRWNKIESWKLNKLLDAKDNNLYTIKISEKDLEKLDASNIPMPPSMSLMFSVARTEEDADVLYFDFLSGPTACSLLGRFTHGSNEIYEIAKSIANFEKKQFPDKVIAEICHLPENRTGNILHRQAIFDYEIPFLTKSLKAKDHQILLQDLTIRIENTRIILWSKKLKKEVIPRLSSAHNYSINALPVYQFLCDLQSQGFCTALQFNWGELGINFKFLPRVEIHEVIVSLASWNLEKSDFHSLLHVDTEILTSEIEKWRQRFKIPKFIQLVDGDNELVINFDVKIDCEMFVQSIKNQNFIHLQEFLFSEGKSIVKDENGNSYANEFIAIVLNELEQNKLVGKPENAIQIQRDFHPGSEWVYLKYYCGVKTADEVLKQKIYPIIMELKNQKLIDKWFFIRFNDPDSHLRVRVHLTDLSNLNIVLNTFHEQTKEFTENKSIWKTQLDTYQREIERYGANTMELSESIFEIDSNLCVEILNQFNGDAGENHRWKIGILLTNNFVELFNLDDNQRLFLFENLKTSFGKEFGMKRQLKQQIDTKYRTYQKEIDSILNNEKEGYRAIYKLVEKYNEMFHKCISCVLEIEYNKQLSISRTELISSYVHMLLNRFFKSKQRLHELLVYDFLYRHYRSKIAKSNSGLKSTKELSAPTINSNAD